jgi:hypothetical protein
MAPAVAVERADEDGTADDDADTIPTKAGPPSGGRGRSKRCRAQGAGRDESESDLAQHCGVSSARDVTFFIIHSVGSVRARKAM